MMKHLFLILLIPVSVFAQKQNNNWFFGSYLGMRFNGNTMSIVPPRTSAMYAPYGCTSWSDPATGALQFYTNGASVYNRFHQQMPNGSAINKETFSIHTLIVPVPGSTRYYYIFTSSSAESKLWYCKVDMQLDNGKGDIIEKQTLLGNFFDLQFTIVRQYYDNGYWLITHQMGTNTFYAYRIGKNGIELQPVISAAGRASFANSRYVYGKMVSSSDGELLAFSTGDVITDCFVQLFRFDKKCGIVTAGNFVDPLLAFNFYNPLLAYPAFSPDNKLLYVSWYHIDGHNAVVQYNLADMSQTKATAGDFNGLADLQLAPDNRIYVTSVENGAVTRKIGVINQPNTIGLGCDFQPRSINLASDETLFTEHFPEFMMDVSDYVKQDKGYAAPQIRARQLCLGEETMFDLKDAFAADSLKWDLGDGTVSTTLNTNHTYAQSGKYPVVFYWYLCGQTYFTTDTVAIAPRPLIDLGNDTTICAGSFVTLYGPQSADAYLWSTGDSGVSIVIRQPGTYSLTVSNGDCSATDEIVISGYPSIWTALGDEYFICDDEKELTKLDAGEGFTNYKWTPTGDTTQWIVVANLGEYFVVVKDFRGCTGNDGTHVKRRCPVKMFFPNAFTPNNDGINDFFEPSGKDVTLFRMTIYNGWGEAVFVTDAIHKTWDGTFKNKPAPDGVYIYKAYYEGYRNKQLMSFDEKGNVTLLR